MSHSHHFIKGSSKEIMMVRSSSSSSKTARKNPKKLKKVKKVKKVKEGLPRMTTRSFQALMEKLGTIPTTTSNRAYLGVTGHVQELRQGCVIIV